MNNQKFLKTYLIKVFKNDMFFLAILVFYCSYNLVCSIMIDFESKVFLPFRYEGLLYFKNAMMNNSKAFFFIRDWSTSFLPEEHPLLYFHNPDLFHFFAGFIQYFFPYPKIVLFTLSLFISSVALYLIWNNLKPTYGSLFTFVFIVLLILPFKAFLLAPQNLFISVALFSIVWNFVILRKIWHCASLNYKIAIELFCAFSLVAVIETNLNLVLFIITALLSFHTSQSPFKRSIIRNFSILFISALPLFIFRAVQFFSVYYYGYLSEYMADIKFTSKQKVQSDISLVDAIKFYSERGINFFGQGEPQTIISNLKQLTSLYAHQYNFYLWCFLILISLTIVIINKFRKIKYPSLTNFTVNINIKLMDNSGFLCAYLIFFVIANYAILFFSGDVLFEISMSDYAFCDYSIIFRAIFIILIPWRIYVYLKNNTKRINVKKYILPLITSIFFVYLSYPSFAESKKDNFSYKKALKFVPPNVNIITNFEPSIVAIETKSRVSMSWFAQPPDNCQIVSSDKLLKMYKIGKTNTFPVNKDIYVFLVFYPPYGGNRDSVEKGHCIEKNNFDLIYEDRKCALYKFKTY